MSMSLHDAYVAQTFGVDPSAYTSPPADGPEYADAEEHEDAEDAPAGTAEPGAAEADADTDKAVADAADEAKKLDDEKLQKLSAADKAKMLKALQAGGKPTGEAREQQRRILRNMQLDPKFKQLEDKRGDDIAKALKGDKELEAARKDWATLSADDKVKALKKVVAAQSKEYGVTPPEIEQYDKDPYTAPDGSTHVENGNFDPSDGKLHLNTHAGSKMSNFNRALDLVLHENGHNYQRKLIKDLKDGKIKEGDPEYTEATVFAANDGGSGYVQPDEDYNTYKAQPKENHSRTIGAETSKKILDAL